MDDTSDDALLNELRRVAALNPHARLDIKTFDAHARISSSAIGRRFGTWSEAVRRAGLPNARPEYSDSAILDNLKRVSAAFPNDPFTAEFYMNHGGVYSRSIFKRRFGGWREALTAAAIGDRYAGRPTTGRMRTQAGRTVTKADILPLIRDIAKRLGKNTLSGKDICDNSDLNYGLLVSRFGSVGNALRSAGLNQVPHGRRHTEEEIFENLLLVWTHYGRAPTHSEMNQYPSTVGSNTYIKRFGGWRNALRAFIGRANDSMGVVPQAPSLPRASNAETASLPAVPSSDNAVHTHRPSLDQPSIKRSRVANGSSRHPVDPSTKRDPSIGLRFAVFRRDRFRCQLCGRSPATELSCSLQADHVTPYSKGGRTTLDNLRTLCTECNLGRGNRGD